MCSWPTWALWENFKQGDIQCNVLRLTRMYTDVGKPHTSSMHPFPTWALLYMPCPWQFFSQMGQCPSSLCWQEFFIVVGMLLCFRCKGVGGGFIG